MKLNDSAEVVANVADDRAASPTFVTALMEPLVPMNDPADNAAEAISETPAVPALLKTAAEPDAEKCDPVTVPMLERIFEFALLPISVQFVADDLTVPVPLNDRYVAVTPDAMLALDVPRKIEKPLTPLAVTAGEISSAQKLEP